ncbi:hypothetical protein [Alteromonas sp. ASW11-130]|uniref:hypothetical protein n=1 Tax=Alteromonas sp. ASW11-130 TaxID=3015775 RepID=UPI0022428A74|nr:hypothetical protein [Alteromonas sp. ASW11-130]MCW8092482.1 hypothetical protein [Alteromonas sp. ASW11-130]
MSIEKTKKTVIAGIVVCSVYPVNASESNEQPISLEEVQVSKEVQQFDEKSLLINQIKAGDDTQEFANKTKRRHETNDQSISETIWNKLVTAGKDTKFS